MSNLNPVKLTPAFKDYLWGGVRLKTEFNKNCDLDRVAESWELSAHKDGQSIVADGPFCGLSLNDYVAALGKDALGTNSAKYDYFPLLIKLIDAKGDLSVQVHPSDAYALEHEGEYGKTEMWYVVDCDEGAELIYGFNRDISREEFERRIRDNRLSEVCNYVPVKKGDVFFIEAGTMHAIGKGILIAEIQQNSNSTYRISDYGRLDSEGKPRPLHIKDAVAVTKTECPTKPHGDVGEVTLYPFGTVRELASCDLFKTELMDIDGNLGLYDNDSFVSLLFLEGDVMLSYAGGTMNLKKGDSVLIPAGLKVKLTGKAKIIHTHL